MTLRRPWTVLLGLPLCSAALAGGLGGCSAARSIRFTNVSDSALNVGFFLGPGNAATASNEFVNKRTFQIKPGETATYAPARNLVHIHVAAVTPSWEPPGKEYWLELLTYPPAQIVATGRGEKLDFLTGPDEVAIIPEQELKGGRFAYKLPGVPWSTHGSYWTPGTRKVIEYAIEEGRNFDHDYFGTEHLLLGLLREQTGVAAQVLKELGVEIEEVREEVLKLRGIDVETEQAQARGQDSSPDSVRATADRH